MGCRRHRYLTHVTTRPERPPWRFDRARDGRRARARRGVAAAPFDGNLRLAEILGRCITCATSAAQRGLKCNECNPWSTPRPRRAGAKMIASFNRGYRGYQQTYRSCTPAADVVIRRYLEEGSKIAREMTARYAN
jgi:uncharacterized protein (TIGR02301 family)